MRLKKFAWKIRKVMDKDLEALVDAYRDAYRDLEDYAYTKTTDIRRYLKWLMNRDRDGFLLLKLTENLSDLLHVIQIGLAFLRLDEFVKSMK